MAPSLDSGNVSLCWRWTSGSRGSGASSWCVDCTPCHCWFMCPLAVAIELGGCHVRRFCWNAYVSRLRLRFGEFLIPAGIHLGYTRCLCRHKNSLPRSHLGDLGLTNAYVELIIALSSEHDRSYLSQHGQCSYMSIPGYQELDSSPV